MGIVPGAAGELRQPAPVQVDAIEPMKAQPAITIAGEDHPLEKPFLVLGTQNVEALAVMESVLRPSGPIYSEVSREILGREAGRDDSLVPGPDSAPLGLRREPMRDGPERLYSAVKVRRPRVRNSGRECRNVDG